MSEVEQTKGVRGYKLGLIFCLIIIGLLSAFAFLFVFTSLTLRHEVERLQMQVESLQQSVEENRFEFYYASRAKQRFGVDDLEEYLDRWSWIEGTYTKDVFDCSEMSAYIEWKLENEGFHTYIVVGDSPSGGSTSHAWLLVETSEGKYMPVEATQYDIIKWDDPYFSNYFEYYRKFETIQEAQDYSFGEFDWWNN